MGWLRTPALFLTAALCACSGASEPDVPLPGQPVEFTLRAGEDVWVGGTVLRVSFVRVAEDSRCPTDVTCVWEGNAAVELSVALGTGPSLPHTLNTSLEPRTASVGDFTLTVLDVTPYPKSTTVILPAEYAVRLRVEV